MDQSDTHQDGIETEVVQCMKELLEPLPELGKRYSSRVIVLAFLTHASMGMNELYGRGEFSQLEVERYCKEFRLRATGQSGAGSLSPRENEEQSS